MRDKIEQEIQAKGLTAPRVTPADLEAVIASEHYFTAADAAHQALREQDHTEAEDAAICGPLQLLTFCVLVLTNGFTVTGESACASPENFNADTGRKIAREKAVEKLWPLLGYQLRQRLHDESQVEKQGGASEPDPNVGSWPDPNVESWDKRVLRECRAREAELAKLETFIDSPKFFELNQRQQQLLRQQAEDFQRLIGTLKDRLSAG